MASSDRLFALLAETQPDGAALARRLTDLDAESLLGLAADVVDASADVRVSWEGPLDASGNFYWSESSTENLTDWIVAQGEAFWRAAVGAGDEQLMAIVPEYHGERSGGPSSRWNGRTPNLRGLLYSKGPLRRGRELFRRPLARARRALQRRPLNLAGRRRLAHAASSSASTRSAASSFQYVLKNLSL